MLILKIKKPRKSILLLTYLGVMLTLTGIVFSFVLDAGLEFRSQYIGTPLILGVLILFILKVIFPLNEIGQLMIDEKGIEIHKNDSNVELAYSEIGNIRLIINGYEMELNRNWTLFSGEFFPYQQGHNNEIIVETRGKVKFKSRFFLNNESEEDYVVRTLTNASKEFKFKFEQ